MSYTLTVTIDATPEEAESRIREALSEEGFGILSEIDIRAKLQEKLGEDIGPYKVLGACNPPLANRASPPIATSGRSYPATWSCARTPPAGPTSSPPTPR